MSNRWFACHAFACALLLLRLPPDLCAQQQLGHKLLGGLGIDAGAQPEAGFYLIDRFMYFTSDEIRDDHGRRIPIPGLDLNVRANMVGFGFTVKPDRGPYVTVAAGVPYARLSVDTDLPLANLDLAGWGDVFVQPVKLGLRGPRYDAVGSYAFYAPTGRFEPRRGAGVGRGYWTHQFSLGGAAYFNELRTVRMSALISYDANRQKRGIDITRGNVLQIQGGGGFTFLRVVTVGLAGFALWQVTDDHGSDIPPALRDLSTRAFGLGPELDVLLPRLGLRFEMRAEREFGVRSRMQGDVLVAGLSWRAWGPARRPPLADR